MIKRNQVRIFSAVVSAIIILFCIITGFYYVKLPNKFYLSKSDSSTFNIPSVTVSYKDGAVPVMANSANTAKTATLKLFGIIPIKEVEIQEIDRPVLVPCGIPFGIKIMTNGVVVTEFDSNCYAARDAGIKIGDVIKSVNGTEVFSNGSITDAVQTDTQKTSVTLERGGNIVSLEVIPVKSKSDNLYKIGVWVRDSSAGIGTVTYYDPGSGMFGGLGHGVCDVDTGQVLPLFKGEAVSASITDVVKSVPGTPGELCGTFLSRVPIGIISKNTEYGIFGKMVYTPTIEHAVPMAFKQEVVAGPAAILTTISGNKPKEYNIMIEKINYDESCKVKNMIVRITDPELLSRTGGIVQGMSGSPIIQNGRLAGAITHVFIGDNTRGYAIFAENMRGSAEAAE
jgi:stage IV sporulation protein B